MVKREILIDSISKAQGPYVQGLVSNNRIYSSQLGLDPEGNLVEGGITNQTRQTMDNFKAVLEAEGMSMDDIVQCTIYIADINYIPQMNEVYIQYFQKPLPSRCCVQVAGMAGGALVEMSIIAERS